MSEEAVPAVVEEEPVKKKKSKLPIILVVVVLLLGGGYFKMKGGGPAKAPEIKLGETEKLDEFLVNLKGSQSYMRTEIGLQFDEHFKKEDLDKNLGAIRDSINLVLSSKKLAEVNSAEGKIQLKRELAKAINETLEKVAPREGATEPKKDAKLLKPGAVPAKAGPVHPEWDSDTGPVLKVYFFTIATQ